MVRFAESLEVHDLPLTKEFDDIIHVRIITQAQNIVVGHAGLLLCCDLIRTTFLRKAIAYAGEFWYNMNTSDFNEKELQDMELNEIIKGLSEFGNDQPSRPY